MGLREQPKFFIVRLLAILRQSMLESGRSFQKAGVIDQADDLFFLEIEELQRLACGDGGDLRGLILKRREAYQRETLRRQIPRLLLSDGRAFYEGIAGNDLNNEQMMGSPVSPGTVTGKVRIVLDPGKARLDPGEILVCPGTDPSWTPLFLSAGGLVMEVGGLMTHGAVVAREYGIPAIVGVHQATQLLADGEEITINGSTGVIQRIERQKEPEEESV
jgi:pyruvate,water dikinase